MDHVKEKIKLGEKIKKHRRKRSLTQAALSQKIGFTTSAISQWENGKKIPSFLAIRAMEKIFSVKF